MSVPTWPSWRKDEAIRAVGAGLEPEPVAVHYAELDRFLRRCGPALLSLPAGELVAVACGGRRVRVIGCDGRTRRVGREPLRRALSAAIEAPHREEVEQLLDDAGPDLHRREAARPALLVEARGLAYRYPVGPSRCCPAVTCGSTPAIACCWRGRPVWASRRWAPCWLACEPPIRGP